MQGPERIIGVSQLPLVAQLPLSDAMVGFLRTTSSGSPAEQVTLCLLLSAEQTGGCSAGDEFFASLARKIHALMAEDHHTPPSRSPRVSY